MLQELSITDFAIIQQVRLDFTNGLIVFTGETGAGKSIVLDAIGALLGDRMGADVVRAGAQRAIVEGVFALPWLPALATPPAEKADPIPHDEDDEGGDNRPDPRQELAQLLREYGLESGDDTIIITREVGQSGRTIARVNGRAVPIAVLGRIG
ncbi:MAG TPA: AAA family ATPase, partial [Ktedonobacterales bacterium]|nr:AAA family ATPase [Ktedonobacterales bacterium]